MERVLRISIWPVILALGLAACSSSDRPPPRSGYYVENGVIRDGSGQVVYLRGINVHESAKYHPDHIIPLDDGEVLLLIQNGINTVRLLTGWAAIMPSEDTIDYDYLDKYLAEVTKLTEAGLFVVLDMHQDVWGHPFGNGAPDWACPEEIKAGYEPTSPWWANYFSEQVTGCFDQFWSSTELQDKFALAWRQVAELVCSNPSVVGFDLLNEPYPGSALGEMGFDQDTLYPFYKRIMAEITEVCPDRIFFLEPSRAYDFGMADALVLDAADRNRVVMAPHYYPTDVHEPGSSYDGNFEALEQNLLELYQIFDERRTPLWFGEYGGITSNTNFDLYMEHITTIFFTRLWGSALWAFSENDCGFSFLDSGGDRKDVFARVCAIPVPVLLPSVPTNLALDFDQPGISLKIECKEDLVFKLLLPGAGSWLFSAQPSGGINDPEVDGHFLTASCRSAATLTIEVQKKPE